MIAQSIHSNMKGATGFRPDDVPFPGCPLVGRRATRGAPGAPIHERSTRSESALLTLLERHPDAIVFAVRGEGTPKPVRVPKTIPLREHERLVEADRKLMDEVIPADRVVVAKLWGQARAWAPRWHPSGGSVIPRLRRICTSSTSGRSIR